MCAGLSALTLLVCGFFASRGHHFGFVDMGHDGYQLRLAIDLSRGGVIFRDTFDQYGPLNGYLNTLGFITFGHRLLAMKYWMAGWYGAIAAVLYLIGRRSMPIAGAAFATLLWLGLAPFYQHGIMISAHAYVLLFQALALLIVITGAPFEPRRFALSGVLIGLSWAVKQSLGAFFLVAIIFFLAISAITKRISPRQALAAAMGATIGFGAVVAGALLWLWMHGALADWYLQTIAFPKSFYLSYYAGSSQKGAISSTIGAVWATFVTQQTTAAAYWFVIRIVVIAAGAVAVIRRDRTSDVPLMAAVTAALWLGTYPSAQFMHQWWTSSLTFSPFVACLWMLASAVTRYRAVQFATVTLVSVAITFSGLIERARAAESRNKSLTETFDEPYVITGIHTTPEGKRAFAMLYRVMSQYRAKHPGTKVASIETSDGLNTGMVESLPLLSFFDDNSHSQPVYWSLPVLSTSIYPEYAKTFRREMEATHPLIVDHHLGAFTLATMPGYSILAAAPSDDGYWYLYAPAGPDSSRGGAPVFLTLGGREMLLPAGDAAALNAVVTQPNNWNISGGLREHRQSEDLYTWPPNLPVPALPPDGTLELVHVTPESRAGAVVSLDEGRWKIDGAADDRYSYLLQFPETPLSRGTYFIARGEVAEGGLTIGLLTAEKKWYAQMNVTKKGRFAAVLQVQTPGRYTLIVANCVETPWPDALGPIPKRLLRNRFDVSQAAWITPAR